MPFEYSIKTLGCYNTFSIKALELLECFESKLSLLLIKKCYFVSYGSLACK